MIAPNIYTQDYTYNMHIHDRVIWYLDLYIMTLFEGKTKNREIHRKSAPSGTYQIINPIENKLTHVKNKMKHFEDAIRHNSDRSNSPNNLPATHVVVPLQFPSWARYQASHLSNQLRKLKESKNIEKKKSRGMKIIKLIN